MTPITNEQPTGNSMETSGKQKKDEEEEEESKYSNVGAEIIDWIVLTLDGVLYSLVPRSKASIFLKATLRLCTS